MKPTIVFIRHAHRDTSDRSRDNGLDDKGRDQVSDLLEMLKTKQLPESKIFWSSPKKRCVQTLEPLSKQCGSTLKIINDLDEQQDDETSKEFRVRVVNFIENLKTQTDVIYLCSHGDWLPEAIQELTGQWVDMKKAQAVICEKTTSWKIK